jgi:hypothetical protein
MKSAKVIISSRSSLSNNLDTYMRTTPAMPTMFVAAFYCLFSLSCKKDNDDKTPDDNNIQRNYSPAPTLRAQQPVMYTGTDTIRDLEVIRAYLTRRNAVDKFAFQPNIPGDNISYFSMHFKEGNKVQLGSRNAEIIERSSSHLLIAEVDSSLSQPVGTGKANRLISMVQLHSPRTVCSDFYNTPCKYRKLYPVTVLQGNYSIPYVFAYVSVDEMVPTPFGMANSSTYSSTQGIMIFNSAMIAELNYDGGINRHDTLVVQILRREMVEQ